MRPQCIAPRSVGYFAINRSAACNIFHDLNPIIGGNGFAGLFRIRRNERDFAAPRSPIRRQCCPRGNVAKAGPSSDRTIASERSLRELVSDVRRKLDDSLDESSNVASRNLNGDVSSSVSFRMKAVPR
jgi:hypothetical protein